MPQRKHTRGLRGAWPGRLIRSEILLVLGMLSLSCQSCFPVAGLSPSDAVEAARQSPKTDQTVLRQSGKASWYGPGFHGKLTASGETYDESAMTAAHNWLPLGSRARVTNLQNGRSVEVTINDRGPFAAGRIIDLSRAAARALGILHVGVATVRVESIGHRDASQ